MAVKYATEAFVFNREDRMDADRIFSVFTKEFGRLEVFGKAIRKIDSKLRGGIDIFSFCEIEFIQGKNKKTLTDAVIRQRFTNISQDPQKYQIALSVCQLVSKCLHGQEKDESILSLLLEVFERLDFGKARWLLYYYFFWNFVSLLGYEPEIKIMELPKEAAIVLALIMKKDWQALEALVIPISAQKAFQKFSEHYYSRVMESHV